MALIKEGKTAPDFKLPNQDGKEVRLSDFQGSRVVVYFYPKDDTPGCTKEACGFNDRLPKFSGLKVAVLGISPDSPESHGKFARKFGLGFDLLSDKGAKVARKYGAWGKKKFMGREYEGMLRSTFIVGKTGRIEKAFENVKPEGHEKEVLSFLSC